MVLCIILGSIFGIPLVCLVHELGHLIAARWNGVQVISISVGLGRELVAFKDRRDTRWIAAALPVGSYVRIRDNGNESATTTTSALGDTLSSRSLGQRAVIYAAGPAFNIVFSVCISGLSFLLSGEPVLPGA
jgi:regulator of sigma E protease